jgi:hypothetical protein
VERARAGQLRNPERHAAILTKRNRSPEYKRSLHNSHLKPKYGITLADYQALHVDHCFDSGDIRGLLCFTCNAGLGMVDHDGERLARAAPSLRPAR